MNIFTCCYVNFFACIMILGLWMRQVFDSNGFIECTYLLAASCMIFISRRLGVL